MAPEKKGSPVELLPKSLPAEKVTVKVNLQPNDKPGWQINSDLFIIDLNSTVPCTKEIIMGDRIISIDGKTPKSAAEATTTLKPGEKSRTVQLIVERRQYAVPVKNERLKQIKHQRLRGFSYFVVNCNNTDKLAKGTLGFSLSLIKSKAYIMSVEPGSIAAQHFAIGDTLLDIDGIPFPCNDATFLIKFSENFFGKGGFTAVVERPTTPQRIEQFSMIYKMMTTQNVPGDNADDKTTGE